VVVAQENLSRNGGRHAPAAFALFEAGIGKAGRAVEDAEDVVIHDQIIFVLGSGTLLKDLFYFHTHQKTLIVFKSACQNEKIYVFCSLRSKIPIESLIICDALLDRFSQCPAEIVGCTVKYGMAPIISYIDEINALSMYIFSDQIGRIGN
jgi:hypothetical protein